ncbi:MAG TPA: prephenate dehydrogenase/arogenate dehydrogenase family protein [Candidatus Methylacidiphilales bacterium]|jgi:prephenate dehydrogenase|nr:prephenate dehydrogenase/arogenate dehydrogenase family protein [Candidatus Methylacidiphilales bacterium]
MNFGTVAILGPGLIGGSLALALAERGLASRLMIYARSPRALDAIRTAGVDAELTGNPSEAVRNADIVILCVPIEAMPGLVREFRDALKPAALVTDVGSVKGSVDRDLAPLLEDRALWIGSHPMAGSEQAGFAAARPDLFQGAPVIITPTQQTRPKAQRLAEKFWTALGSKLAVLPPEKHDQLVAAISHIPHLIAAALVNHAVAFGDLDLAAGGFRDTTRIAAGSPELWSEILLANGDAVGFQLRQLISRLTALQTALNNPDMAAAKSALLAALKTAHDARSLLSDKRPKPR